MFWMIILATFLVSYANGANDNIKGVASLIGSRTTSFKTAIRWATLMTFLGSLAACFFATKLVNTFGGKGLFPDALLGQHTFLVSVILGAGFTVLFASRLGIPISTTHSLIGALVGVGMIALHGEIAYAALGKNFIIPLIVSPFMAVGLSMLIYPILKFTRKKLKVTKNTCVCIGGKLVPVEQMAFVQGLTDKKQAFLIPEIIVGDKRMCETDLVETYQGRIMGVNVQSVLTGLHFLTAGAVSFARGLHDTPKIVGLAVVAGVLNLQWNVSIVAVAMAIGGLLGAKRVAKTVSWKITSMNHGQGFTANAITAFLVIFASHLGVPVSTTHVSCGALFGIGAVNKKANGRTISGIVSAWVLTLPLAALLSASVYFIFTFRSF